MQVLLLVLAAFPWGWMKGPIERRLSDRIGKPVTIGAMARADSLSFHPTVTLRDLRVPQPGWVRPALPDLARIGEIRAGFSVWGLLTGGPVLERLEARRARLHFYRDAQGRVPVCATSIVFSSRAERVLARASWPATAAANNETRSAHLKLSVWARAARRNFARFHVQKQKSGRAALRFHTRFKKSGRATSIPRFLSLDP